MKYLPLLWSGLWRKRTRTWLTLAAITVAFLLFGLLQGVNAAFGHSIAASRLDRLYVQSRISFTEPLPSAYQAQIEAVPGVDNVAYGNWFGGYFQDAKNFVFSFAVDADRFFSIYPELGVPPDQLQALINIRTGAIIGIDLAKKYGWKIGDKVPLKSQIWTHADGSYDWDFDVVGIFDDQADPGQNGGLYFNYKYFDEGRGFGKGTIGWYIVHLTDISKAGDVAKTIDAMFANSTDETKTQNEKENTQSFLRQFGDIQFMVTSIIGAVFFALLFLTGNTMMQSIRERVPEFAVLKTLGFSDAGVLAMVFGESLLLCVCAALIGLGGAVLMFPFMKGVIGVASLPPVVLAMGIGCAVLLAILIGLWPAAKVRRLSIVDSLAGR